MNIQILRRSAVGITFPDVILSLYFQLVILKTRAPKFLGNESNLVGNYVD